MGTVEVLALIQDGDVVFLDWPNGERTLVKGSNALTDIVKTGGSRKMRIARIPISTEREAEVIAAGIKLIEAGDFHIGAEASFCRLLDQARRGLLR